MTAKELIEAVEVAGGSLAVEGDKLACEIPEGAEHLIPELQAAKSEIITILKRSGNNQPFVCTECGTYFDTTTGIAIHEVHGCGSERVPTPVVTKSLPSCPACGSFALFRERDGTRTCQTCGKGRKP